MVDGFEVRLSTLNHGGAPDPDSRDLQYGSRFSPRFRLKSGIAELNLRFEGSVTNADRSPLGLKHFDSQPSSSLSRQSPYSFWEHEPRDDNDRFQGNFGMRQLNLVLKPHKDIRVQLGPNRYEIVDAENLCMEHAFGNQCKYALLSVPLGYAGAEVDYDREREDENFKRLKLGVALMHVGYGGVLAMGHGLFSHYLGSDTQSPLFTLHGYIGFHDNPSEDGGDHYLPGITHGEGFVAQLEHGITTGLVGFGYRRGNSLNEIGFLETSMRSDGSLGLTFKPGEFQIHSMLSYLTRQDLSDDPENDNQARHEWHSELSLGHWMMDGLLLALGYRGYYGEENAHMGFLGFTTDFRHTFPFTSK